MNDGYLGSLKDPVEIAAKEIFTVDYLYPYQRLVIANTLDGLDQIVILPTGSGKSLCFQLSAQFLSGFTLVVVPLLSLLHDHLRRLKQVPNSAGVLKGGQPQGLREELYTQMEKGKVKIVFATPEVLLGKNVFGRLMSLPLSHLVLDEAHCVSEWGESFRPAYLSLGENIQSWNVPLITAFTATASPCVISRLQKIIFNMRPVQVVKDIPDRPNIFYKVIPALSKAKVLTELCQKEKKPLVIFCRSRTGAEQCAKLLYRRLPETNIFFYHAGLDKEEREKIEKWFFTSNAGILVSTSAYGMGVDKADIRTVIHADVPPSVEAYLQESGRAGRDGKPARALVLFGVQDLNFSKVIAEDFKKQRFLRILACVCQPVKCRRQALLEFLGSDLEYCSGCDFCNNEVIEKPGEENDILAFLKHWNRRFTLRESIQVLKGENGCEAQDKSLSFVEGFGILSAWEKEDINEALYSLWEAKKIAIPRRGFFKHRIQIRHSSPE